MPVSSTSTIRVKHCAYSVPSRLIGERVRVRIYEDRIEVYYADKLELGCERLRGKTRAHRLPARHLVAGAQAGRVRALRVPRGDVPVGGVPPRLRRDPDAAARDQGRRRVPAHPAPRREHDRGRRRAALAVLLAAGEAVTAAAMKAGCASAAADAVPPVPALEAPPVDLAAYDALLAAVAS